MARKRNYKTVTDPDILIATEALKKRIFNEAKLEVANFGTFELQQMRARRAFVPGSGKYKRFPAYVKVSFTPALKFKQKLKTWKNK